MLSKYYITLFILFNIHETRRAQITKLKSTKARGSQFDSQKKPTEFFELVTSDLLCWTAIITRLIHLWFVQELS